MMSSNKFRIPELRSSLCGCSLELATKIIGWFNLALGVLTFVAAIILNIGIVALTESKDYKETEQGKKHVMSIFLVGFGVITWFLAFYGILQILINLLLLKGVYEKKSSYIWPWVVCQLVFEVFDILFEVFFDYRLKNEIAETNASIVLNVILELFGVVLLLYCIWLVYSYYRQLKRQNDDLPAYESHVYPV